MNPNIQYGGQRPLVKSGRKWETVQVSGKSRKDRQDVEGRGREEKKMSPPREEILWRIDYGPPSVLLA